MPVVEARQLTHVFPNGKVALAEASLRVETGEFVVIAGANGSGKTVFIRHLNGLLAPTQGEVLLDGEPIRKDIVKVRQTIGLIFQDSESQIVGQTVAEDVAFGPENLNLSPSEVAHVVEGALARVGLSELASQDPHTLSGGQKRRLAIAGVLAMNPKILIFDEPFTGLDYPGVVQVLQQLVALHAAGHAIIVVTHELEKVLAHATRLVLFHEGRVVEDGSPEEVVSRVEPYGVRMPLRTGEKVAELTWLA